MVCPILLSRRSSKFLVLGTLWAVGIALLFSDYSQPFRGGFSYAQFWLGILFCLVPALFLLLDKAFTWKGKVFILFMWGATLYLPKVLRSPDFLNLQDEILHFQTLKLVYESGTLNINPTIFKVSMYYPGLELLTVSLKLTTNLSFFSAAILLIGLIHLLSPVFIFFILRRIASSELLAALGAFIFTSNTSYFCIDSMFSYESLGILFVVVLVFLVSKKTCNVNNTLVFSCLSIVMVPALVITHHFSSYMFLLFLMIFVLVQFYKRTISKKWIGKKVHIHLFALLTVISILAWLTYDSTVSIKYFQGLLIDRIKYILGFVMSGGQRELFWQSALPKYEIFINYLYIPLILLLSGLGVYFIRKAGKMQNIFVYSLIVYGPLLHFLSLSLIPTYSQDITYRSWPFLFIGVSFSAACALHTMIRQRKILVKTFTFSAVILIMVAGISLGDNQSGRFPGAINHVSGPAAITSDVVYASNWFEVKNGRYNNVIGDLTVSWVFGGYGVQNAMTKEEWNVFFPKTINSTVMNTLINQNIEYVIVDKRITEFLGKNGYYFSRMELDQGDHPGYGLTQPLPKECLDKFDDSIFFNNVFANGNINIYEVCLGEFSG